MTTIALRQYGNDVLWFQRRILQCVTEVALLLITMSNYLCMPSLEVTKQGHERKM